MCQRRLFLPVSSIDHSYGFELMLKSRAAIWRLPLLTKKQIASYQHMLYVYNAV